MQKIKLHTQLAFNQWYLSKLIINPRYTISPKDWKRSIKRQRRIIKLLEKKLYGTLSKTTRNAVETK